MFQLSISEAAWYESVEYQVSDPFRINSMHSAGMGAKKIIGYGIGDLKAPAITRGHIYRTISSSEAKKISSVGPINYIHFTNTLDAEEKKFWKSFFNEKGPLKVPFVVNVVGVFNPYVGATALLLDTLANSGSAGHVSSSALAELMEEGGRFVNYLSIVKSSAGNPYLHTDIFYETTVQGRKRSYGIYSKIEALNIAD